MNFNYKWTYKEQYPKIDKLILEHITKKWEKWDWRIKNTRDKKKYKIVDFQYRTRKTMYGLVTYKRRIYEYFDEKLQKLVRVCLVDEKMELPKYKRIGEDIEDTIIEYFADGKRYHDICAICKKAGISVSTVHRVFKNLEVIEANPVKVKLEKNQPIFVAIDDGHRKFWNFKRKGTKHSMRLIVTYTDNINHKVQNKRVKAIIRPTKTAIGVKKTAEFVKEHCQKFYENIEQAKIIICGDSAGWIKEIADYLDAQFVLDKFHLIRTLYLGIMAGNKGKYLKEYNYCKNLINNGQYEQLIDYLYKELDNHKKLKKKYFKNNKQGIENQGAKWNIGCFTETNIWHVLKEMLGNRTYNILTDFSPHVLVEETMKLNEFNNTFQTEKQCLAYIASLKQSKCIRCSSFNLNTSNLRKMRCLKCHQTFSILTGTIFSKSQTPLISWFYLIFRWINTKHGIPSTDVAKELGVTLKTAWRMGHKIRSAIAKQEPQFIVEGIVQMDEMYLSHMGFKKQGRSLLNKTLIVGIYEKTTNNLIVKVLKNANSKNLLQFAINHISSKCDVHTDSWKGYRDLKSVFTKHETVNHQDGYVSKTGVNTNQIESVWKHIRRTFKTHIKVAKHHIHLYAKEAAYKFNNIPSFETVMLCLI